MVTALFDGRPYGWAMEAICAKEIRRVAPIVTDERARSNRSFAARGTRRDVEAIVVAPEIE